MPHPILRAVLALACAWAVGCAHSSNAPTEAAVAPVSSGPVACEALAARLVSLSTSTAEADWLDAPSRNNASRRARALEARASALGCGSPQS